MQSHDEYKSWAKLYSKITKTTMVSIILINRKCWEKNIAAIFEVSSSSEVHGHYALLVYERFTVSIR